MRAVKTVGRLAVMVVLAFTAVSCVSAGRGGASKAGQKATTSEVMDKSTIYEVISHLYRWYFDEVDVQKSVKTNNDTIWVRTVRPPWMDSDDHSQFNEIILPVVGVSVLMKKADYTVPELGLKVKSDHFVIARVERIKVSKRALKKFTPIKMSREKLRDYLFSKRGEVIFPNDRLVERLRAAVREELIAHFKNTGRKLPAGDITVYFAPLSPVANEVWCFWEGGRVLIRFSSDMNLSDEALWQHGHLTATIYDLDTQVVVSLQEVPGSNAYLTRDQVGRALYNCVILGRAYKLKPRGADSSK